MSKKTPTEQTPANLADERIVTVSGQEFRVPRTVAIDAIRTHLAGTFPEVAAATAEEGTKEIDGVTYQTVTFVKKSGTKGAIDGKVLAATLARLPTIPMPVIRPDVAALLQRLEAGNMAVDIALDCAVDEVLMGIAPLLPNYPVTTTTDGERLCQRIATCPAVADPRVRVW